MTQIIKLSEANKFKGTMRCMYCFCEFSFGFNDIFNNNKNGTGFHDSDLRVLCPMCYHRLYVSVPENLVSKSYVLLPFVSYEDWIEAKKAFL